MATALETYRALIPAHGGTPAAVPDATVEVYLDLAVKAHAGTSVWGVVYLEAMVYYAAHLIERTPGLVTGSGGASEVGALVGQKDDLLQRSYGPVGAGRAVSDSDLNLQTTRYGLAYLRFRGARASTFPSAVRVLP